MEAKRVKSPPEIRITIDSCGIPPPAEQESSSVLATRKLHAGAPIEQKEEEN